MVDIVDTHQFAPNSLQIECTCLVDNSTLNWVVNKAQCAENDGLLVSAQTRMYYAVLKSFKDRWKLSCIGWQRLRFRCKCCANVLSAIPRDIRR